MNHQFYEISNELFTVHVFINLQLIFFYFSSSREFLQVRVRIRMDHMDVKKKDLFDASH